MFPHKKDTALFNSVPVSRVGSSQRLNLLVPSAYNSIPSTPSAYVSLSLNPSRNLPVNAANVRSQIRTKDDLERFEQLPIVKQVAEFESLLNQLSSNISSFKEDNLVPTINQIIAINDSLRAKIDDLDSQRELGLHVKSLQAERDDLTAKSKHILKELVAYRNELKQLPRMPAARAIEGIDIQEVLKYALKLAKFTKAPTSSMQFQVHPNNFVWPAEDALRRGMLATASLQADEIIKHELGTEEVKEPTPQEVEDRPTEPTRRGSFGGYGGEVATETSDKPPPPAELDLDLFDPEDEYSD